MNILFYTPVNFRCRDIESLAQKFIQEGHSVFFLSTTPHGAFHTAMQQLGVSVFPTPYSQSLVKRVIYLIRFCYRHKISVLYSHLEPTNFVSVIAQYFIKAKVIIFRHHIDAAKLSGFDKSVAYRLTYLLAKKIVAVSSSAVRYMIGIEKLSAEKIFHINLGYNFNLYELPNNKTVSVIRSRYKCELLLITVGRLTKYKRIESSIEVLMKLRLKGVQAELIIMGTGEKEGELKRLVSQIGLEDQVHFIGFVSNPLTYLASADLLIHPSISESSCVVVKEAGLVNLPVIICEGIGDFDEYMINNKNGIVLDRNLFVDQATLIVMEFVKDPTSFAIIANELNKLIQERFSIKNTFNQHMKLLTS